MSHKNQQLANAYVFDNNIPTSKADLFALCIMPKATFAEDVDDNNNDFEVVAHGCKRGGSRLSARDNQTQESVIGPKVAGPDFEQELSEVESLKKTQFDK